MASTGPRRPSGPAQGVGPRETPSISMEKLSFSAICHILVEFVIYCGRAMVIFCPVYLTGYLGLSISWVLLCMFILTYWKKNRQWKDARIGSAIELVNSEMQLINTELKKDLQMASWVESSDVEKVHWLNKVLEQVWPFFGMYMEKLLRENIQPSIRASAPMFKAFTFTKIHFGCKPLRVTGIRAYTHEVGQEEVVLDMNMCYDGDVVIRTDVSAGITAGVKGLKLQGMMRVILEPFIGQAPLVGGVTFFFIRRPRLHINWTGMPNLLSFPGLSTVSEETIVDAIASFVVLPNRMCIPLIDGVKMDQMRFPLPRGVVRVHLLEARDLVTTNTFILGLVKGKSDPYATLRVGSTCFKSKTIKENLHPKWNEVYEFIVHEAPGQELELELYNESADKDDFIGRYNLDFGDVKKEKQMDQWFPVDGVQHGEVHLKLQWLSLRTDTSLMKESTDGLASAMLAVYLYNASELPVTKRTACPNSFVEMSLDSDIKKSKVVYASTDPVWEEGFTFFVHNANSQKLTVQVKEYEKKTLLGVLNLPLSHLLTASDLTLDQHFQLQRSGANTQIKLKVTLRILTLEDPASKIILSPPVANQFNSHSLLSENSVASSRFNLNRACYPEAIRNHQGLFGEIELSVRYATMRNKLLVFVTSCRNLFPCSENGTDSYVHLYLLPNQSRKDRKKTHVKKRTVNPVFREIFEFDVSIKEAQTRKLYVSVKNNKMLLSKVRKDIGSVILDLSQLDLAKGRTAWYELTLTGLKKSI